MPKVCPTDFGLLSKRTAAWERPWSAWDQLLLRVGFHAQRSIERLGRPWSSAPNAGRALQRAVARTLRLLPAKPAVREWLACMSHDVFDDDPSMAAREAELERWLEQRATARGDGVVMAISSLGGGGAERQMTQLARALAENGETVRVAVKHAGMPDFDTFTPVLAAARIPIEQIRLRPEPACRPELPVLDCNLFALVRGLLCSFRVQPPAVVHGWMDELGAAAGFAAISAGVARVVIDLRGFNPTWFDSRGLGSTRAMMRVLGRRSDVSFVANTSAGLADYVAWLGQRPLQACVIRNAIRNEDLRTDPVNVAVLRKRVGASSERVIGGLMRFTWEKDPLLWVETAAAVCERADDVRFVLFGDGPLRSAVERRIRRLGLRGKISLLGRIEDRGAALRAIDALLVTSQIEGSPNVVIEAQSVGKPVVAPNVGGIAECLAPSLRAFLVSSRSPSDLAEAALAALAADYSADALSAFVQGAFAPERQIGEYRRLYATLVG